MRIPKKCGRKPKGRQCEAFPTGTLKELDDNAIKSLKGEGKNHLTPTYKRYRWGSHKPYKEG